MNQILLVALGGSLGAVGRYLLGGCVLHYTTEWRWLGTLAVNVLGCLVAGVIAGLIERQNRFSGDMRIFLMTGVMGGFTTFSAFGVDTVYLLKTRQTSVALSYVALSVLGGLLTLWLGMSAVPHRAS